MIWLYHVLLCLYLFFLLASDDRFAYLAAADIQSTIRWISYFLFPLNHIWTTYGHIYIHTYITHISYQNLAHTFTYVHTLHYHHCLLGMGEGGGRSLSQAILWKQIERWLTLTHYVLYVYNIFNHTNIFGICLKSIPKF